ncbi:dTMP kinase [Actinomycetospora endophytica]|uniref:Thymidylate kinase n=1 Tax=Actinomycetospora endophytica TaxID=2291215 RepID=A0ABS8PGR5_9PSEU|nr:dTMP kinase [Actinomycetospora endophytica]MCD2197459.1 dTMP kinase [Actinomycetospora endophytica]
MGVVVAVEGLDGAGKATLVDALGRAARARGASVATLAFPRYDDDVHAALAGEALHGEHGDTAASVHAMALLFALDRRAAAGHIDDLRHANDLVLVDRYVASNAAYGSARLHQGVGEFAAWVRATEIERFAVPAPDAQVLVRVPPELAAERVRERARTAPDRDPDGFEADAALQQRCAEVYDRLAAGHWWSPWWVAENRHSGDEALTRTADAVISAVLTAEFAPGSSVRSDTIET